MGNLLKKKKQPFKKKKTLSFVKAKFLRLFGLAAFLCFVFGGILAMVVENAVEEVRLVSDNVLEVAKEQSYKPEILTIYKDGKEVRKLSRTYDEDYNVVVTEGDKQWTDEQVPYLQGSYVFLSLLDKELDIEQEFNVFEKMEESHFSMEEVVYGETEAPSYFLTGEVPHGVYFFEKELLKLVELDFPKEEKYKVEVVINKRLATVKDIKIRTMDDKHTLLLSYSS